MQIFADADACPVVGIVEKVAKEHSVPVTLLCDTNHVLSSDYSEVIVVATQQAVYHWLNGRSLPSIDNVYALSELFRVPIDKIICGNRGYQPEQRSIYYRLKAYVKYLQLYVEVTYEDVSLFSN